MRDMKQFGGKCRIVEMEVPGYIRIDSKGTGRFQFRLVSGDIDGRVERCGEIGHFEFSWSGQDENDPAYDRGWAIIEDGELHGRNQHASD